KEKSSNPRRESTDLATETLEARREWHNIFKFMEHKTYNHEYLARLSFRCEGEIKNFTEWYALLRCLLCFRIL
ncbi:MAG: hypothetical protein ACI4RU_03615, partial [Acutalibacteraceae bacterium]